MGKHLTQYELGVIWGLRQQKKPPSYADIGKKLGKDKSTIQRAYNRLRKNVLTKENKEVVVQK